MRNCRQRRTDGTHAAIRCNSPQLLQWNGQGTRTGMPRTGQGNADEPAPATSRCGGLAGAQEVTLPPAVPQRQPSRLGQSQVLLICSRKFRWCAGVLIAQFAACELIRWDIRLNIVSIGHPSVGHGWLSNVSSGGIHHHCIGGLVAMQRIKAEKAKSAMCVRLRRISSAAQPCANRATLVR